MWTPNPGPQLEAVTNPADELLYGGAAAGGKTDLLIGVSIRFHQRSLILRREATQLKAIRDRLIEILGRDGWRSSGHGGSYTFPNGDMIELGGCKDQGDEEKYRGQPHDLKAFDELTHFTEKQYETICAWNRSSDPSQRCRIVSTSNPPTDVSQEWVLKRWAAWVDIKHPNPAKSGEIRYYAKIDNQEIEAEDGEAILHRGEWIIPTSRTFIQALMKHNPYQMKTDYMRRLQSLPEPLRSQLIRGDFSIGRLDNEWQCIPTAWIKAAMLRWKKNGGYQKKLDCVGADIAAGGLDTTVAAFRYGNWCDTLRAWPGHETPDGPRAAAKILEAISATGQKPAEIRVDAIGYGSSCYDSLRQSAISDSVLAVKFGNSAQGMTDRAGVMVMRNLRALAYWSMREMLDPNNGEEIALPDDPELLQELAAPKYKPTPSGILIEEKDDISQRLGRSPDKADAVVMAFMPMPKKPKITFHLFGEQEQKPLPQPGETLPLNDFFERIPSPK